MLRAKKTIRVNECKKVIIYYLGFEIIIKAYPVIVLTLTNYLGL